MKKNNPKLVKIRYMLAHMHVGKLEGLCIIQPTVNSLRGESFSTEDGKS